MKNPLFIIFEKNHIFMDSQFKNRKHTIETKEKMSKTHKINKNHQKEKNSQFGTCWIRNDFENKKIKKEELEYYLSIGYIQGRKIKR